MVVHLVNVFIKFHDQNIRLSLTNAFAKSFVSSIITRQSSAESMLFWREKQSIFLKIIHNVTDQYVFQKFLKDIYVKESG